MLHFKSSLLFLNEALWFLFFFFFSGTRVLNVFPREGANTDHCASSGPLWNPRGCVASWLGHFLIGVAREVSYFVTNIEGVTVTRSVVWNMRPPQGEGLWRATDVPSRGTLGTSPWAPVRGSRKGLFRRPRWIALFTHSVESLARNIFNSEKMASRNIDLFCPRRLVLTTSKFTLSLWPS